MAFYETTRGTTYASENIMTGLSKPEIFKLVNSYIGFTDGYLGDFSYRTHAECYPEFCDLDIDPTRFAGTTREKFVAILRRSDAGKQAKILRGILQKYPVASAPVRTPQRGAEI